MKNNEVKENKELEERDFDENTPAILIQDLHKSYGKKEVLKGRSMFKYFFYAKENIPTDVGFQMDDKSHILWLCLITCFIVII